MSLPRPHIEPLGDAAFMASFQVEDERQALSLVSGFCSALQALPAITDLVPAFNRVCVHYDPVALLAQGVDPMTWMCDLAALPFSPAEAAAARRHDIPVCYHPDIAPDLVTLAERLTLSIDALIECHAGAEYRVSMIGFAPGFPYLTGLSEALRVPRRANPRTRVEPGSVAIAEHMCGIYPKALPGGWHVIGRSPVTLFDVNRAQPCLLAAGDTVCFHAITLEAFEAWPC